MREWRVHRSFGRDGRREQARGEIGCRRCIFQCVRVYFNVSVFYLLAVMSMVRPWTDGPGKIPLARRAQQKMRFFIRYMHKKTMKNEGITRMRIGE